MQYPACMRCESILERGMNSFVIPLPFASLNSAEPPQMLCDTCRDDLLEITWEFVGRTYVRAE